MSTFVPAHLIAQDFEFSEPRLWRISGTQEPGTMIVAGGQTSPEEQPAISFDYELSSYEDRPRFVEFFYVGPKIDGDEPHSATFWVNGDGSEVNLLIRFMDADGVCHQWKLPYLVTWTGWQQVTVELTLDPQHHRAWNPSFQAGPNKDVIHDLKSPVSFRSFVIHQRTKDQPIQGTLSIGGLKFE